MKAVIYLLGGVGVATLGYGTSKLFRETTLVPPATAQNIYGNTQTNDPKLRKKLQELVDKESIEAENLALERKADIARTFAEEHRRDIASWRFSVKRYGQFITIAANRFGGDEADIHAIDISISLSKVTDIALQRGHLPDNKGVLNYDVWIQRAGSGPQGTCNLKEGDVPVVEPKMPTIRKEYSLTKKQLGSSGYVTVGSATTTSGTYTIVGPGGGVISGNTFYPTGIAYDGNCVASTKETKNFPRAAEDDQLTLNGAGLTILIPGGLGEGVYQDLLKALE